MAVNAADLTNKLTNLKVIYAKANEDRLKAERDLQHAENQLKELGERCRRDLGIEPDKLEVAIDETEKFLLSKIAEIEAAIPPEYLDSPAPAIESRLRPGWGSR
jgi:hypothetical protein